LRQPTALNRFQPSGPQWNPESYIATKSTTAARAMRIYVNCK
jgi:hypothetical protein